MDKLKNSLNIYCDESRVENTDSKKMVIGSLFIPRKERDSIVEGLKQIYNKHKFVFELKWTKTNVMFKSYYQDIVDYFVKSDFMQFRCIVVDKTNINYEEYHNDDRELAFFKFYYFMLKVKLLNHNKYYIIIDKKPTRDKNRARSLHYYLSSYILLNNQNCSMKHLQAYDSKENILLQLTDYLTGLVGYAVNNRNKKNAKSEMVVYLKDKLRIKSFNSSTPLSENKFNIFVWKDIDEKDS